MIPMTAEQVRRLYGIPPGRLRVWVWRGHITRCPDGRYDAASIQRYITRRDRVALDVQVQQV